MDASEIIQQIGKCILFCRQNDNNNIQYASQWLTEFCTEPSSIHFLLEFYSKADDPADRQHAIINLGKSFKSVWNILDPAVQRENFEQLLHLIIREPIWINRRNIIDIIQFIYNSSFDLLLIDFIKGAFQSNQPVYLEIALLLARFIPASMEQCDINFENVIPFFKEMLEKGLISNQPEVRLAAFDFMIHSVPFRNSGIIAENSGYWDSIISTLDMFITPQARSSGSSLLLRLIVLYNESLSEKVMTVEPAIILCQKVLSYFWVQAKHYQNPEQFECYIDLDLSTFLNLHTVINSICKYFAEAILCSNIFDGLVQMYLYFSNQLFNGDDIYPISNAQFFEQTFKDLCITPQVVEHLWDMIFSNLNPQNPQTIFAFLRSCAATFEKAPEFYSQRFNDLCSVLNASIRSRCPLLMDCAARTAREFVTFFFDDADNLSMTLFDSFYDSCCQNPSSELIETLTVLLESTRTTDGIFDQLCQFLVQELKTGQPDVQQAVIPCITAICKRSIIKVVAYSSQLLNLFEDLLKCNNEQVATLKSYCVESITIIAIEIGPEFVINNFMQIFFTYFVNYIVSLPSLVEKAEGLIEDQGISSVDIALVVSCLKAINTLVKCFGDYVPNEIYDSLIPKLIEIASIDYSCILTSSDIDNGKSMKFLAPAYALRSLTSILSINEDYYSSLSKPIMKNAILHMKSSSIDSRVAAANSIKKMVSSFCNITKKTTQGFYSNNDYILQTFVGPLTSMINIKEIGSEEAIVAQMEVNIEVFKALGSIIHYFSYEPFNSIWPSFLENLKFFITSPQIRQWRPKNTQRDIYNAISYFLEQLCCSAITEAFKMLQDLIPCFLEMGAMETRFQSLSLRFFTYLITECSFSDIPSELIKNVMEFAMKMTLDGKDYAPFVFITKMSYKNMTQRVLVPYLPKIIEVIITKLNLEFNPIQKDLMIRDTCLSALSSIYLSQDGFPFKGTKLPSFLEIEAFLKAFPPALYYRENRNVAMFFIKLYDLMKSEKSAEIAGLDPEKKNEINDLFLQSLVTIFCTPEIAIEKMQFGDSMNSGDVGNRLEQIFIELLSSEGSMVICQNQIMGDENKMQFLQQNIEKIRSKISGK